MVLKRAVILKIYISEWSNFANTQKQSTKFSGMLGEDEKMISKNFVKFF